MRTPHAARRAFLSLAVLAAPGVLPAQETSQSLPPELVTALFSGGSGAAAGARYYVGTLPPGWPTELTPPASIAVVGGMQAGSRMAAVFVDSTMRLPQERLRKQLEDAGWSRPPTPEQEEGFTSNSFRRDDGRLPFWCRDSIRANMLSTRAAGSRTYVRMTFDMVRGQSCVPERRPPRMMEALLPLPPLYPPERVRQITGGSSSGGHSLSNTTQLADSTTTPSALLAHYAAQLTKAGWTVRPSAADTTFASQALEATDKDGKHWYGMLIVLPSAKTRDVAIMMTRTVMP